MSGTQPRSGPRESYVKGIKYSESSILPECRSLPSQTSKEKKIPSLTSDHKYLYNKASGKSLGCCPFESSWRSALLKTQRIKKAEYSSTFGLKDCKESPAVPNLIQGIQSYQENLSTSLQMNKGFACAAAKSFPAGGDVSVVNLQRRGLDSWNPGPLKMPAIHDGGGEIGALRSKKNNPASSAYSLLLGTSYKLGHQHFTDPFAGAPPEYIQRLSEMKSFECETIRQEKIKTLKRGKKQETRTS
ncbi:putative uncharacterized protein C8orf89 homolog [Carettochelys insculpta]|uniref:putative uncharacterized protein C8orf89 homolog n=1 Tax=Carettochelys insculpta TaxID=44489 RepID=UPI003EC0E8B4